MDARKHVRFVCRWRSTVNASDFIPPNGIIVFGLFTKLINDNQDIYYQYIYPELNKYASNIIKINILLSIHIFLFS